MKDSKKREDIEIIIRKLLNRKKADSEKAYEEDIRKVSEKYISHGMASEGIKAIYQIQIKKIQDLAKYYIDEKFNLIKKYGLLLSEDDLNLLTKQASEIVEGAFPHLRRFYENAAIHGNLPGNALKFYLRKIEDDKNVAIGYVKDEVEIKGKLFRAENSIEEKDAKKKIVSNWKKKPHLYASPINKELYGELFFFENKLRHLVHRILKINYGQDWLNNIPPNILSEAKKRMKQSLDIPYLENRPSLIIWYCLLSELKAIITSKDLWPIFKSYFKPKELFQQKIKEMNSIRNRLAHNKVLGQEALDIIKSYSNTILKQAVIPKKIVSRIEEDSILGVYNNYLIDNRFLMGVYDKKYEFDINISLRTLEEKDCWLLLLGNDFLEIMDKNIDIFSMVEYLPFTEDGPQLSIIIPKKTSKRLIYNFLDQVIESSKNWFIAEDKNKSLFLLGNLADLPEYLEVNFTYIPMAKHGI